MNFPKSGLPDSPPDAPERPTAWRAEAHLGSLVGSRYRLDAVIGHGGSGATYRANDLQLDRAVALKLIVPRHGTPSDGARYLQEARIASRLRHPHIVEVFDVGTDAGLPFLVMELLEGESLERRLRNQGKLSPQRALELMFPILGAVAFAHDRTVLHRDLKPDNIFLARIGQGDRDSPQLLDFGVARATDSATLTRSGTIVGTPAYMSPEQALDEPLTAASDVWSLGVVLHFMLSGSLPFEAEGLTSLLLKIVNTPATPLWTHEPRVPRLLAQVVDRALRRDASARPPDARQLARALLLAAVQEGIPVPGDPEPIGLPEYEAWRQTASASGATLEHLSALPAQASEPQRNPPRSLEAKRSADSMENVAALNPPLRASWKLPAVLLALVVLGAVLYTALAGPAQREALPTIRREPAPTSVKTDTSSGTSSAALAPPASTQPAAVEPVPPAAVPAATSGAPSPEPSQALAPREPDRTATDRAPTKRRSKRRTGEGTDSAPSPASGDDLDFQDRWR